MYYKIQPEQIQIHNFSSPSGDLNFVAGSNYVYANLSRYLTGEFVISGGISINGVDIPVSDISNYTSGQNSFVFGGISNDVVGVRNVAFNGNDCSVEGTGNAVFNSQSAVFPASSANNTSLGGRGATFGANTTGSTIIKDGQASAVSSNGNNSLTISFGSGIFVENGNLSLKNGNLNVGPLNSGVFSGNLQVLGNAYKNGVAFATTGDLYVTSGALSGRINSTGQWAVTASGNLASSISSTGATLSTAINNTGSGLSVRINNTGAFAYSASGALDTRLILTGSGLAASITGVSGYLMGQMTGLDGGLYATNVALQTTSGILDDKIDLLSGNVIGGSNYVLLTGNQTVSGQKIFVNNPIISGQLIMAGSGGVLTGEGASTSIWPTSSSDSVGTRGMFAFNSGYLFVKVADTPAHVWARFGGLTSWTF